MSSHHLIACGLFGNVMTKHRTIMLLSFRGGLDKMASVVRRLCVLSVSICMWLSVAAQYSGGPGSGGSGGTVADVIGCGECFTSIKYLADNMGAFSATMKLFVPAANQWTVFSGVFPETMTNISTYFGNKWDAAMGEGMMFSDLLPEIGRNAGLSAIQSPYIYQFIAGLFTLSAMIFFHAVVTIWATIYQIRHQPSFQHPTSASVLPGTAVASKAAWIEMPRTSPPHPRPAPTVASDPDSDPERQKTDRKK